MCKEPRYNGMDTWKVCSLIHLMNWCRSLCNLVLKPVHPGRMSSWHSFESKQNPVNKHCSQYFCCSLAHVFAPNCLFLLFSWWYGLEGAEVNSAWGTERRVATFGLDNDAITVVCVVPFPDISSPTSLLSQISVAGILNWEGCSGHFARFATVL